MERTIEKDGWADGQWPMESCDKDILVAVRHEVSKLGDVADEELTACVDALHRHKAVEALEARLRDIGDRKVHSLLEEILPTRSAVDFLKWQNDLLGSCSGLNTGGFLAVQDGVPFVCARVRLEPLDGAPPLEVPYWWEERVINGAFMFRRRIESCDEEMVLDLSHRHADVRRSGLDPFRHVRFDPASSWEARAEFVAHFVYEVVGYCGYYPVEVYFPAESNWQKLSGKAGRVAEMLAGLAWNPLVLKGKED